MNQQQEIRHLVFELLAGCIPNWEKLPLKVANTLIQHTMRTFVIGLYMGKTNPELASLVLELVDEKDGILEPHKIVADVVMRHMDKVFVDGSGSGAITRRDLGTAETDSRATK